MAVAVKICGLSSAEGVAAAIGGGAAYLGFVFFPPSPRAVTPAQAAALCSAVPAGVQRVGMFVNADDEDVAAVLDFVPLDILQFHGSESVERVRQARTRFGLPIMKAIPITDSGDVCGAVRYDDAADLLLFDAKPPRRPNALPGGNGLVFDWRLIAGRSWRRRWMLSGGLTAELLPEAVHTSGAVIVDVSSGVEIHPGHKDPEKIRAFLAVARAL
ncbi:MAG: phosphoribosylanthranilate isomerase [Alphaproteobacteria bacterium]|nr:phosphoribosylanthranilate isomerase [Alphaproteobacteria bacterium]